MPPHVLLPRPIGHTGGNMPHGQIAGFLGKTYDPFVLESDPSDPEFKVPDLLPPDYLTAIRAEQRRKLRDLVDGAVKAFEASPDARLLDSTFDQAYKLMSSPEAREAFDLSKEPDELHDRYGRNRFGMCCLLARRLIEPGVRFVTVNMFETVFNEITWDIHGSAPFSPIEAYRDLVGPMFDQAYAALLEDLTSRGLLDNTLIVAMGEFGRTPKINPAGGRDHWPQCWTISMAGGGVQGRAGHRRVRRDWRLPEDRPVPAAEVAATIYRRSASTRRRTARPAGPAAAPGRLRRRADPGAVLT